MDPTQLQALLTDIQDARIAVIGDYCLDIYWMIDLSRSEPSLETGLGTHPVSEQRYSLGGAGNVINNLAALGVGNLHAVALIGDDPWGKEMLRLLHRLGVETAGVFVQEDNWATLAYTKPHVQDVEQNRLDFGNFNKISSSSAARLLDHVASLLSELDVLVINQQVIGGIHSDALRSGITQMMAENPQKTFIADSRHFTEGYQGAHLKLNDHEAARICGITRGPDEMVLREESLHAADEIYGRFKKPVFITRGARGLLVRDEAGVTEVPGLQILVRTDPVGAGDSVLAGIASALAVGRSPTAAAVFGSLVAGVTIQKLRQTGTATPGEVLDIGSDPDYVYRPEVAEDTRRARYLEGTEIEIITHEAASRAVSGGITITHAIFDHDGTISTLRQGWEAIMEPMMVRAILGEQFETADESLYRSVIARVRDYIDKSTGVQTLVQMRGLVALVREFGCVPEESVLDDPGYKDIYNEALMEMVRSRLAKFNRGELGIDDFTMKNAVALLGRLRDADVKLYLASGTDQNDVEAEARALGYADMFEGRIYGSVGDVSRDAKRIVLDRVLSDVGRVTGQVVTFGDGPIEVRETCKRGGFAVGVASDEVRRYGQDNSKRSRLIRAGADLIIPDFSQIQFLLRLLGLPS